MSLERIDVASLNPDDLRVFSARNPEYYVRALFPMVEGRRTRVTINWAAFIFGPTWFAFRRMLWWGVLLQVVTGLVIRVFARPFSFLWVLLNVIESVLEGLIANRIYFRHLEQVCAKYEPSAMLARGESTEVEVDKRAHLSRNGGISWIAAIVLEVAWLGFMFLFPLQG